MATANKNLSDYDKTTIPNASNYRFGIVVSEWNDTITEGLYEGAYNTLIEHGVSPKNITRSNVPGSYELIFGCKIVWIQHLKRVKRKSPNSNHSFLTGYFGLLIFQ